METLLVIAIKLFGIEHRIIDYQAAMISIAGVGYFGLSLPRLMQQNHQLEQLAYFDPLTGLLNRRRFFELFSQEFNRSKRYAKPLSLVIFDLDHFKRINDKYGHAAGDKVLIRLAGLCKRLLREQDMVSRIGGEEFVLLLPEIDLDGAKAVAERLRKHVACHSFLPETALKITISLGVTRINSVSDTVDAALQRTDRMLYQAKRSGRNKVAVHG